MNVDQCTDLLFNVENIVTMNLEDPSNGNNTKVGTNNNRCPELDVKLTDKMDELASASPDVTCQEDLTEPIACLCGTD